MITSQKLVQLFLVFVLFQWEAYAFGVQKIGPQIKCVEKERQALLKFKQEVADVYNRLSSWGAKEYQKSCCKWEGVYCDNRTGNVIRLYLHAAAWYEGSYDADGPLMGQVSHSLLELKYLEYLDLSGNEFDGSIPVFFGSFTRLKYLNLSHAGFEGIIPHELRNLSGLHTLDLSLNYLFADNLEWLLPLQSLKNLFLDHIDLSKATEWLKSVNNLPLLRVLHLSYCILPRVSPSSVNFVNSSRSLVVLDVSSNYLGPSIYTWLFNHSNSLSYINLQYSSLQGPIPNDFAKIVSLLDLDLSYNMLEGGIPSYFGNYSLKLLSLSSINLITCMPELMKNLSGRVTNTLEYLNLEQNSISGPLADTIVEFPSLKYLNLGFNRLNGSIPKAYGQLPNLEFLGIKNNEISGVVPDFLLSSSLRELYLQRNQLSGTLTETIGHLSNLKHLYLGSNYFEGVISETHLLNLSRLETLDLSFNSHLEFRVHLDWIPPFQLQVLNLRNCKIGSYFPKWLQTQKTIVEIDISATGISGDIPSWFWDQRSGLSILNLSYNLMHGTLPNLYTKFSYFQLLDLSSNDFEGPIPQLPSGILYVNLSKNRFSGNITCLCNSSNGSLMYLDLSDNQLSGQLLDCWEDFGLLVYLNLANNNLSGKISPSIGSLSNLEVLQLRNNKFTEELPQSWKNSELLNFIDFGQNGLFGNIPSWVWSNLSSLVVLSLSSNNFSGNIHQHICNLSKIQILDLSRNNISGTIPKCISNFSAMTREGSSIQSMRSNTLASFGESEASISYIQEAFLIWKGRESQYKNTLALVKIIDLSSNNLLGFIPLEVTGLVGLVALNLSRNSLTGILMSEIGELKSLEFLDLSRNRLFGEIPSSLSQLSFLGVLNLSFNNFTGRIPSNTHLQTYEASSFGGNPGLCGRPLTQACPGDELPQNPKSNEGANVLDNEEHEENLITAGFYLCLGLGFILGFWGVCGTLFFNRFCRHSFFRFVNKIGDWLYGITALKLARLQRRLQG